uniref:Uncharacterized protein LOC114340751 n=1 Tax=Diabrotica virgifera virgifera TaxID=50390 RepID=A0A6P7GD37_DIAVI
MDTRFERGFSLAQSLDIIYNDELIDGDIFVEPPDTNVDTDEDSGDEDGGGLVDNLLSRQLRTGAKIRLPNNERIGLKEDYIQNEDIPGRDHNFDSEVKNWISDRLLEPRNQPQWLKGADL